MKRIPLEGWVVQGMALDEERGKLYACGHASVGDNDALPPSVMRVFDWPDMGMAHNLPGADGIAQLSPQGAYVAFCSQGGGLTVCRAQEPYEVVLQQKLPSHEAYQSLAFWDEHTILVAAQGDLYVADLHNPNDMRKLCSSRQDGCKYRCVIVRGGRIYAFYHARAKERPSELQIWGSIDDAQPQRIPIIPEGIYKGAFVDAKGDFYVLGSKACTAYSPATGDVRQVNLPVEDPWRTVCSEDGRYIALCGVAMNFARFSLDFTVYLLDGQTHRLIERFDVGGQAGTLGFSSQGRYLLVGGKPGLVIEL